jgi:RsiW-degrading membrane proteinase PrsW (M82 family)
MLSGTNLPIFALFLGLAPAAFWLWFWLKQDELRPEPKSAIFSSFGGGVVAVFLALFFELIIYYFLVDANPQHIKSVPDILRIPFENFSLKHNLLNIQADFWDKIQGFFANWKFLTSYDFDIKKMFLVVIMAPVVEELLKLTFTYNICLRRKVNDEPIDASIYMLTSALGFAAIETALIIYEPLSHGRISDTILASNFRSIGPMLIHIISSATLGIFIGLAFYKSKIKKFLYLVLGYILAVLLHALFNFFIVLNDTTHNINYFWLACFITWTLVIVLLIFFKKVRQVTKPEDSLARKI